MTFVVPCKKVYNFMFSSHCQLSIGGIMVSIAAFQAVDPGSIPGRRTNFIPSLFLLKMFFARIFGLRLKVLFS